MRRFGEPRPPRAGPPNMKMKTAPATGVVECGFACHTRVAAKDYIFTAYGKR